MEKKAKKEEKKRRKLEGAASAPAEDGEAAPQAENADPS